MTGTSNGKLPEYLIDTLRQTLTTEQKAQLIQQMNENASVKDWIAKIELERVVRKINGTHVVYHYMGKRGEVTVPAEKLVAREKPSFISTIFTATGLVPGDKPDLSFVTLTSLVAETETMELVTGGLEDGLQELYNRVEWADDEESAINMISINTGTNRAKHPMVAIESIGQPYYRLHVLQTQLREMGIDIKRPELVEQLHTLEHEDVRTSKLRFWRGPEGAIRRPE